MELSGYNTDYHQLNCPPKMAVFFSCFPMFYQVLIKCSEGKSFLGYWYDFKKSLTCQKRGNWCRQSKLLISIRAVLAKDCFLTKKDISYNFFGLWAKKVQPVWSKLFPLRVDKSTVSNKNT